MRNTDRTRRNEAGSSPRYMRAHPDHEQRRSQSHGGSVHRRGVRPGRGSLCLAHYSLGNWFAGGEGSIQIHPYAAALAGGTAPHSKYEAGRIDAANPSRVVVPAGIATTRSGRQDHHRHRARIWPCSCDPGPRTARIRERWVFARRGVLRLALSLRPRKSIRSKILTKWTNDSSINGALNKLYSLTRYVCPESVFFVPGGCRPGIGSA